MIPNTLKTNVAPSQSAGFWLAKEALSMLSDMQYVNADDGASSKTVQRRPFVMRDASNNVADLVTAAKAYRLQTTIETTSYFLYQGGTNWILDSMSFAEPVDTGHAQNKEIHLVQSNGMPVVVMVDGGVTMSKYDTNSLQFESLTVPSGLSASTTISTTVLEGGAIVITDGSSVFIIESSVDTSFPLTTSGTDFAIEGYGGRAICWTSNGTASTFHVIDRGGVLKSFTTSETGEYRGSNPLPNGLVVYLESATHYKAVEVSFSSVVNVYYLAKTAAQTAGIDEVNESLVAVFWYYGGFAKVISKSLIQSNGDYFLYERDWNGTSLEAKKEILTYTDSDTKHSETLGSVDVFTWGSRSNFFFGKSIVFDHSYIPASILIPASGGGGGKAEADTLQTVTDRGATTTNNIIVNGLTATADPIDAQGDFRAQSNVRFDLYGPVAGHNLLIVGTDGTLFTRSENYYTTEGWVNSQGFATQTWVNQQNFATQSFVTSQGYVDENLSSLSFNVANGVLTASLSGGTQTTVDLDGRYLQSLSLNDLTDVDGASNKNDGAVMQWSAVLNRFVLSNTLDLRIEGSDLLADNSPTAGQVYQYNGSTFQWATVTSGGVTSLNDIGDVSVASPNTNDVLTWNGSTWIASASGGGGTDGVVTSTSFIGGVLTLNRSNGLPALTQTLDGRYLQSYTETDPTGVSSIAFSGTNTKTLTITRNNGTTVQASFTDLQGSGGGGGADGVVNGGSYNNGTGALTLTRTQSLSDIIIQMGGNFMSNFFVAGDTTASGGLSISNGNTLSIKGDTNGGIYTRAGFSLDTVRIGIEDQGVTTAKIADEAVTEAKLDIANTPSNGQVLTYDAGDMVWVTPSGGGGSADGVVSNATFNTSNGILSLSRTQGLPAVTVDLDGRYITSSSFTFVGDATNGSANNVISKGETFQIKGIGGIVTAHGLNDNELLVTILPDAIREDRLKIANAPTDGQVLSYDAGDMVWTPPPASVRGAESSSNTPSAVFTPSATLWSKVAGWGSVTSFGTSFVSQASNTFTVSEAGVYEVSVSVFWDSSASSGTTYLQTGISVNNVNPAQSKRRGFFATTTSTSEWVDVKGTFNLSANDTITIVHLGDANSGSAKVREAHINFNKLQ